MSKKEIQKLIEKYDNMFKFWINVLSRQLEENREPSNEFYVNPDIATAHITDYRDIKRDLEELLKWVIKKFITYG